MLKTPLNVEPVSPVYSSCTATEESLIVVKVEIVEEDFQDEDFPDLATSGHQQQIKEDEKGERCREPDQSYSCHPSISLEDGGIDEETSSEDVKLQRGNTEGLEVERDHVVKKTNGWEGPYQCSYSSGNGDLKMHGITHTGERSHGCSFCEKSFKRKFDLKLHERTHTGEKPYECSYCEKCFARRRILKVHERTHTGERPYQCSYCEKSFQRRDGLKEHERTHTGEKPFKCGHCEKSFKVKGNLKVHVRTHTGERPYQCSYCDKAYKQRVPLKAHLRTHKQEKENSCREQIS